MIRHPRSPVQLNLAAGAGATWLTLFALLPAVPVTAQVRVTTYHNNLARTGENLQETILTLANVNAARFGKIFSRPVDGQIYAQPLYMSLVSIPGKGIHNVVFVATEHDSVYAFDADASAGGNAAPLWHDSFIAPAAGVTTVGVADISGCSMISPELGITGTPVIDPATNTLYVVAMTKENGSIFQRLHALDIATGAERPGSPVNIQASVPGNGDIASPGVIRFYPERYRNRSGLLLLDGVVYTGWSSHCDQGAYHGWIMGYDAATLHQTAVFNATPDGYRGSIWMGGAAPAADADGNIYVISGNGKFDADAQGSNFADSFLKLSPRTGLTVADYFTPFNQEHLDEADIDLGSSGALLLPDGAGSPAHPHLVVSAGKEGRVYLLDRDRMGRYQAQGDSQVVQSLVGTIGPLFGIPAYFHNTVYFSAWNDALKAFPIAQGLLATAPSSQSSQVFGYPGSVPSISANGSSGGIVWAVEAGSGGTLHAYDATNLSNELYNSRMQGSRDALGSFVKFSAPTVANGKVYVGTSNALVVFGLLGQPAAPSPSAIVNAASFQPGPVAPGSLISVFGFNLARATLPAASLPLPLSIGGAALSINGIPASLLFVSRDQINAQVPFEVAAGPATAVLDLTGMPPATIPFWIAPAAPGLFTTGQGQAAVQNEDGSLNSPGNPARPGSLVSAYLTGLGAVTPPIPDGEAALAGTPALPVCSVTATIGGRSAVVVFAGLAPGTVGVFQVNLRVPGITAGSYPLVISANGVSSNSALLAVSGH